MLTALEVLLPIFVTMLLGYGAAWHHRFDEKQVPVLNKMVLLYAVPMSVSVGMLKTSRAALRADIGLLVVLIVALAAIDVIAFVLIRYVARRDLATSALQALAIAFPAGPFVGPSLLSPLFGPASSALLIVAVALVGNIFIVPFTMVCLSMAADQETASSGPSTPQAVWTSVGRALADALRQPIVWAPALSLIIVLLGVTVPQALDDSLSLLGGAAGGVGLFTTGIVLQAQRFSLSPASITSAVGKNVLTPLAALGIAYLLGQGAVAGHEIAVSASIFTAPILVTLAVQYGVAEQEMSSALLLSAATSPLTTGAFIAFH
jgi:malonate transporter and related proteins